MDMSLEFGPNSRIVFGLVMIILSKIVSYDFKYKTKSGMFDKRYAKIYLFIGLATLLINAGDSCLLENQGFQNWDECGGDSLVLLIGILIYNFDRLIWLFKKKVFV